MALTLSACISPPHCQPPTQGDVVYAVSRGWHAEIGVPVNELGKDLAFYDGVFSGARVIMFGYGKRTFFTAPPDAVSEYFLGPFPGPAVIHVVGLRVAPTQAYPPEDVVTLNLPPGGRKALSDYIWNDLRKNASGKPEIVARGTSPDGLFYRAQSEYTLLHTCNSWTAEALHSAGLPISSGGVIFSGQAMSRVQEAAENNAAHGSVTELPGGTTTVVSCGGGELPPKLELHAASAIRARPRKVATIFGYFMISSLAIFITTK